MQSTDLLNALQNSRLYHSLEPEELELLMRYAKPLSFPSHTTIIKQGRKSAGIYLILEGRVSIAGQIMGAGRVKLASLGQGQLFGGSSTILKGANATSVIAETKLDCLLLKTAYFEMLSYYNPGMKYKISREIAEDTCNRLLQVAKQIKAVMSSTDMTTQSLFSEVVRSFTKPTVISYEEAGLDFEELEKLYPLAFFNEESNRLLEKALLLKTLHQCPLLEEGGDTSSSYLILRGAVQSSIMHENKIAKISILGPGSWFFPLSILNEKLPAIINYTSYERAILLKMEKSYLAELQKSDLNTWYKLFDLICESFVIQGRFSEKLDIRINSEFYNR